MTLTLYQFGSGGKLGCRAKTRLEPTGKAKETLRVDPLERRSHDRRVRQCERYFTPPSHGGSEYTIEKSALTHDLRLSWRRR